jgi:L-lactate dehydrogenase complex protein LldF
MSRGHEPLPTRPAMSFQDAARLSLADAQLRHNMGKATQAIREKRARVVAEMPDWEALREAGRAIKDRTLRHLPHFLEQLEAAVTRAGGHVHWASDAGDANAIVADIAAAHGAHEVVKIKSLTTDEIGLNEALGRIGIEAIETDLAELIIQLAGERSSHILVPAIHKNRAEIRELFRRRLAGTEGLTDEPRALAAAARAHLRRKFLSVPVAVSGANFGVAETGTICIVESEGNGRMCLTLPKVLISVMGIEKVVPAWRDMEVFLQLLPRSSTAERMNPYTSFWTGVAPGDGPQEFHLVLLDNGRTKVLASREGRQTLQCIRCSACLNICPVYERTGGHAYNSVYPGPIGAILTPQLVGVENAGSLPYASSLCGACYDVCPVKINIPQVLLHLRGEVVRQKQAKSVVPGAEALAMKALAGIFSSPSQFERMQKLGRIGQRLVMKDGVIRRLPGYLGGWTAVRDVFPIAPETFREWWRKREKHSGERTETTS